MKLTEHFTLEELTTTSTGYDNTPSAHVIENLKVLATTLELIRTALGKPIQVTSAYRSLKVNNAVKGSAALSFHTQGLAADIKIKGLTPFEVCSLIKNSGIPYDKLILEDLGTNGGWTHIQIQKDPKENRMEEYTIRTGTGYLKGIVQKGK
jgi:zinc D-Ala-D-Ala carboxypeptidase